VSQNLIDKDSQLLQRLLVALSLLGAFLFGAALLLSFLSPVLIERAAREVVRIEVERRVGDKIDSLSNSRLVGLAQRVLERTEADIAASQQAIRNEVPKKVANVIASMLDADCECRQRLIRHAEAYEGARLSSLTQLRERLVELIESAYASVTRNLLREFRIFSASNAGAFLMLALVTAVRRRSALQLLLPAVVLVGAVAVTAGLYLFNQNWLHTVVFGQYIGLAYLVYLIVVALMLTDVVFNRARVTGTIVQAAFGGLRAAVPVASC
jgi:hypothetical protein